MFRLALRGALLYRDRLCRKGKYLDYRLRVDLKHNAFASPDGRGERGGHDERRQP